MPIVGDCKRVLHKLLALAKEEKGLDEHRKSIAPWHEQIEKWRNTHRLTYQQKRGDQAPVRHRAALRDDQGRGHHHHRGGTESDVDGPILSLSTTRAPCSPRAGWGPWGTAFPRPSGPRWPFPGAPIIDIAGDGSIQMNIQELATAVQYKLPVKVAILNNGYLGMVRQWQELFYERRYAMTHIRDISPDFVKLAEAYGAVGLRATRPDRGGARHSRGPAHPAARVHGFRGGVGGGGLSHGAGRRVPSTGCSWYEEGRCCIRLTSWWKMNSVSWPG